MAENQSEITDNGEAELRKDIERARAELDETIDAIGDKINPQQIKANVQESVREATVGRAEKLAQQVNEKIDAAPEPVRAAGDKALVAWQWARQNPIPCALGAMALVWFVFGRGDDDEIDWD